MIALFAAALMVRAAHTIPAGRRDQVALVSRPRGVVHAAVAPLSPSGRWVILAGRTVCRAHTRRLGVLPRRNGSPDLTGRRVCVRCQRVLAARTGVPGLDGRPMNRAQLAEAFAHLRICDLSAAAASTTSVDEVAQVGRLALILFGPKPMVPRPRRTPAQAELADLHGLIDGLRRKHTSAALSDEEREAVVRARDTQTFNNQQRAIAQRRAARLDLAHERRRSGRYLDERDKQLLNSA